MRLREIIGQSVLAGGIAFTLLGPAYNADASGFRTLYSFKPSRGEYPQARLIEDAAGNLFGTTFKGGGGGKHGVVFRLAPDGTETVLYAFAGGNDGANPQAALTMDSAGNLYGTTLYGGGFYSCDGRRRPAEGCGTVFKIDASGTESVLHAFTGGTDGAGPRSRLVEDAAGNLYGTTAGGGDNALGTVFMLAVNGNLTVLHSFTGYPDGSGPLAGLVMDALGNLYGTTYGGGGTCGCGTVFKVTSDGVESVLYAFAGGNDGESPMDALIRDADGNLYGTTEWGGGTGCYNGYGCGTVFKIALNGKESLLHTFGGENDGINPADGLVRDASGNLYGTTPLGGQYEWGTVYKLAPDGAETILNAFDAESPSAGLLKNAAGILYGVSAGEPTDNEYGEIWMLNK